MSQMRERRTRKLETEKLSDYLSHLVSWFVSRRRARLFHNIIATSISDRNGFQLCKVCIKSPCTSISASSAVLTLLIHTLREAKDRKSHFVIWIISCRKKYGKTLVQILSDPSFSWGMWMWIRISYRILINLLAEYAWISANLCQNCRWAGGGSQVSTLTGRLFCSATLIGDII